MVLEVNQPAVHFGNRIGKLPMVQIGIKLESPPTSVERSYAASASFFKQG
jgi:hypothetical protein